MSDSFTPFEFNGYVFKKLIGSGTYSDVYEIYSEKYDINFAAKVTPIDSSCLDKDGNLVDPELMSLVSLDYQYVIRVYDYFLMNSYLVLILELCQGQTLLDKIEKSFLTGPDLQLMFYRIAKAVEYCHGRKIAHCDIKPANILIDQYDRPKIADFGFSTFVEAHNMRRGSYIYAAPEIFLEKEYNPFIADIYSLGITFYQAAMGSLPWTYEESIKLPHPDLSWPRPIDPNLKTLITLMAADNPNNRPSIRCVLNNPYFKELNATPTCIKRSSSAATYHLGTRKHSIITLAGSRVVETNSINHQAFSNSLYRNHSNALLIKKSALPTKNSNI